MLVHEDGLSRSNPLVQMAEYRPLAELKPVIHSLLEGKQLSTANTLLYQLQQRRPMEYRQLISTDLLNRLIESHLGMGEVDSAQGWTERHPQAHDALTYAIWLGYWIDQGGQKREVERWLERMQPLKPAMIIATNYLSLRQLAILRSIDGRWEWSPDKLPSLLDISTLFTMPEGKIVTLDDTVRQMDTKLGGASLIRDSLQALRQSDLDPLVMQEKLERDCYQASQDRLERSLELYHAATGTSDLGPLRPWLNRWLELLKEEYRRLFAEGGGLEQASSPPVNPYFGGEQRQATCHTMYAGLLAPLKRDIIALIVLQELTKMPSSPSAEDPSLQGIPLCRMAMSIGKALERELFAQQISQKKFLNQVHLTSHFVVQSALKDPRQLDGLMTRVSRELERNEEAVKEGWIPGWTPTLRAEVGAYLIHGALRLLQIEDHAQR